MHEERHDIVELTRDCLGVRVPSGDEVLISKGAKVWITQALGGSFTVNVRGSLYRIAGKDADALGKEPPMIPELPPDATDEDVERLIIEQMKTCFDPEIPINIVDLGLVYDCNIDHQADGQRIAHIRMTLTAPGCGMGDILAEDVKSKVELVPTVKQVHVQIVFDPPWDQDMMSDTAKLEVGLL